MNVSSSSPLKCTLRFKWLGAFTWLTRNIIFEPQTLLKASKPLEAGPRPPPVEQGVILFACPLETDISLKCHAEYFSQDFRVPVEIFESSGSSRTYLRPVEKSEVKACGSKNSFCRIILSGRGPFEVRRDVLNRVRMKRTWSQLRLKILFTGKKRDNQGSSGLEAFAGTPLIVL